MIQLTGYKLGLPTLIAKNGGTPEEQPPVYSGSWNLSKISRFYSPAEVTKIAIVNFSGMAIEPDALLNACRKYGMAPAAEIMHRVFYLTPPPYREEKPKNRSKHQTPETYRVRFQKELESETLKNDLKPFGFLLVVLPGRDIPLYCEVKRWTDCILGMPSACITQEKLKQVAGGSNLEANVWYVISMLFPTKHMH